MRVPRNWRRVEHGCRGARMADYRAVDLSYGPRSSAGITSVEDQSIDIKERSSIQQIHSGPPASDGPGTRSGVEAPTGFSTPAAVITPAMLFQRPIEESSRSLANAAAAHNVRGSSTAKTFFTFLSLSLNTGSGPKAGRLCVESREPN